MFKVNYKNTRATSKSCEICLKLTIKTPERKYFTLFSSVSTVDFEQVNVSWEYVRTLIWIQNDYGSTCHSKITCLLSDNKKDDDIRKQVDNLD